MIKLITRLENTEKWTTDKLADEKRNNLQTFKI
jgi:hypothetical protein